MELDGIGVLIGMGGGAAFGAVATSLAQMVVHWFKGRAEQTLKGAFAQNTEDNKLLEFVERSYRYDDATD